MSDLVNKIRIHLMRLRLQPIRVLCVHEISEQLDADTMWECDWIQIDVFKERIEEMLKEGVRFISLEEAYNKIQHDYFRFGKYAVITADDGYESVKNIMPWLAEKQIPITLFISPALMLGKREMDKPTRYLSKEDICVLESKYADILTIGNHGYMHNDCSQISIADFEKEVEQSESILKTFATKVSFFAYPYGHSTTATDEVLEKRKIIPVYCDGAVNYNEQYIRREILS